MRIGSAQNLTEEIGNLHKKLVATLTVTIFIISTFAILAPVQAHFTLGLNNEGAYPYTVTNFDPHTTGVIGYVWPGGGEDTYDGSPTGSVPNTLKIVGPGYVAPYPLSALAKAGVYPAPWSQNYAQEDGDEYAPFGAIVVGSTGDLIFAINRTGTWAQTAATCPSPPNDPNPCTFNTFYIAIPPEFKVPNTPEQIVTTITNNYDRVLSYTANAYDRYVPGWTLIRIEADVQNPIHFYAGQDEWYYVRVNGVTAPTIAGRYFFKMFLVDNANPHNGAGILPNSPAAAPVTDTSGWVPTPNWPVLLVKGELDPSIITGTIKYGGYNSSLYGQPVELAGRVWAQMQTKFDPYTGKSVVDCTKASNPSAVGCADAVGYFNETSDGHYEVEGVAPGVYTLYAEAAGYPQTPIATNVQVLKGQSLHFDGYLNPGPVIHGDVYSKHAFGSEPWPFYGDTGAYSGNGYCANLGNCYNANTGQFVGTNGPGREYIKIELYDKPTVNNVPSSNATVVSWSPLPCVAGGQTNYYPGLDANACGDPRTAAAIAFPWGGVGSGNSAPDTYWNQVLGGPGGVFGVNNIGAGTDPQGVGPAQNWYVVADGVNDKFHYEFGEKGMFGAPRDLDGHVPQRYATWVNGLTAGRYYVRAWVFRYVQTAIDGATFQEYSFQVTPNEWAGDISIPLDLRISSWINKTVHFHDNAGTLVTSPIDTGATVLVGSLLDSRSGVLYSYNQTLLCGTSLYPCAGNVYNQLAGAPPATFSIFTGVSSAYNAAALFSMQTADINYMNQYGNSYVTFYGFNSTWLGQNYGIPAGTYRPKVQALGYLQQTQDVVSVTLSGTPIQVSNHLYRGVGFNFTVYSIDWERPRVNRNWVWNGKGISIGVYDAKYNYVTAACHDCTDDEGGLASAGVSGTIGYLQNRSTYFSELEGRGTGNAKYVWFGLEVMYFAGDQDESTPPVKTGSTVGGYMLSYDVFTIDSAKNVWVAFGNNGWALYPTALDSGQYYFLGWTYGYIQDKDYTVYVNKGQIADMKINLLIGVNITLDIVFKKEHLVTGTPYNMSARVRFFDDSGRLVAEWMSSEGVYGNATQACTTTQACLTTGKTPTPNDGTLFATGRARAADNTPSYEIGGGLNYVPGGVNLLHVLTAGLPPYGFYGDPVFTPGGSDFEIDRWPADYWSVAKAHFANEGILGQPDYTGTGWTAEADFVNWYLNDSFVPQDPSAVSVLCAGPFPHNTPGVGLCESYKTNPNSPSGGPYYYANYYPVVPGLLMGESFHIIPGTAATSHISLTEDGALDKYFLGHSMVANHLGPYSQEGVWTFTNAPLSGETSAIWEVDLNGYISGTALAFTWSNEFRSISWYTVTVQGAAVGNATGPSFASYTEDGIYEFYLLPGTYSMSMSGPGYRSTPMGTISVTSGQTAQPGSGNNVGLPQSNIPVPEFSGIAVVALSALAASLYLLRRRRQ